MREEHFKFGQIEIDAKVPDGLFADIVVRLIPRDENAVQEGARALEGVEIHGLDEYIDPPLASAYTMERRGEPWKDGRGVGCGISLETPTLPSPEGKYPWTLFTRLHDRFIGRRQRRREWDANRRAGHAMLMRAFGRTQ